MAKRAPRGLPLRFYQLRIDAELYGAYQALAKDLGVSLGLLFTETLEYGLRGGQEPPSWWGGEEHLKRVSASSPRVEDERPVGVPSRSYSLRLHADVYARYQEMARGLGVSMSRLFYDTLRYGLEDGQSQPAWWDDWQARAAQDPLLDQESQESAVSP